MRELDLIIDPDDPENGGIVNAYVFLKLHASDPGNELGQGRISRPEFASWRPFCVSEFTVQGLTLEISNAGRVASDLVGIDYQVIFCTLSGHGPTDGFTVSHAGEAESSTLDKLSSVDFVPPSSSIYRRIVFPQFDSNVLSNIYFRARVSTIWTKPVPKPDWDFRYDVALTEAHLRIL